MQLKIGYLFQCPPWARSFCPFRACGAYLRNLSKCIRTDFIIKIYKKDCGFKKYLYFCRVILIFVSSYNATQGRMEHQK